MDNELRDALRRVEPPAGFAERVLAQAKLVSPKPAPLTSLTGRAKAERGRLGMLAAAAALVIAIGGSAWYRAEERRRQGEEARRQVLQSLSIAGEKLRAVQMKINHQEGR